MGAPSVTSPGVAVPAAANAAARQTPETLQNKLMQGLLVETDLTLEPIKSLADKLVGIDPKSKCDVLNKLKDYFSFELGSGKALVVKEKTGTLETKAKETYFKGGISLATLSEFLKSLPEITDIYKSFYGGNSSCADMLSTCLKATNFTYVDPNKSSEQLEEDIVKNSTHLKDAPQAAVHALAEMVGKVSSSKLCNTLINCEDALSSLNSIEAGATYSIKPDGDKNIKITFGTGANEKSVIVTKENFQSLRDYLRSKGSLSEQDSQKYFLRWLTIAAHAPQAASPATAAAAAGSPPAATPPSANEAARPAAGAGAAGSTKANPIVVSGVTKIENNTTTITIPGLAAGTYDLGVVKDANLYFAQDPLKITVLDGGGIVVKDSNRSNIKSYLDGISLQNDSNANGSNAQRSETGILYFRKSDSEGFFVRFDNYGKTEDGTPDAAAAKTEAAKKTLSNITTAEVAALGIAGITEANIETFRKLATVEGIPADKALNEGDSDTSTTRRDTRVSALKVVALAISGEPSTETTKMSTVAVLKFYSKTGDEILDITKQTDFPVYVMGSGLLQKLGAEHPWMKALAAAKAGKGPELLDALKAMGQVGAAGSKFVGELKKLIPAGSLAAVQSAAKKSLADQLQTAIGLPANDTIKDKLTAVMTALGAIGSSSQAELRKTLNNVLNVKEVVAWRNKNAALAASLEAIGNDSYAINGKPATAQFLFQLFR